MSSRLKLWRATRKGSSLGLWQGDAGEALSVLLAELIDAGQGLTLTAADYPPFYRSLLAGQVVRPRAALHPRLFIWGPLEARLQQPDLVILGSLNEGVWPRPQEAGPWLSRPMREKLGLNPPERRIGLAAHDFAQALGAPRGLSHPRRQGRRRADRAVALAAAAACPDQGGRPRAEDRGRAALGRMGARARPRAVVRTRAGPRAKTASRSAAEETERDPDRAVDRQPLRDFRPIRPEARDDEGARRRA